MYSKTDQKCNNTFKRQALKLNDKLIQFLFLDKTSDIVMAGAKLNISCSPFWDDVFSCDLL